MHFGYCFLVSLLLLSTAKAQAPFPLSGAESEALGGCGLALAQDWSLHHNPALLALLQENSISAASQFRTDLPELTALAVVANYAFSEQALALSLNRTGFGPLRWQQLRLGWGHTIGPYGLGLSANLLQTSLQGYGSRRTFSLDAGFYANLWPEIWFAGTLSQINFQQPQEGYRQNSPLRLRLGLRWESSEKFSILTEIDKVQAYSTTVRLGLRYRPLPVFQLATGVTVQPAAFTLGTAWKSDRLSFAYGGNYQALIGLRHQLSFSLLFGRL